MVFIILAVLIAAFVGVFFLFKNKKKKKLMDDNLDKLMDNMNFKRASVNTSFLDKLFHNIIESVVYSRYSQDTGILPAQNIVPPLHYELEQNVIREHQLKLKKKLYEFRIEKIRVTKQENSSIHSVSYIEAEGSFFVEYLSEHSTAKKHARKNFTQRFIFINTNNSWLLEKILPENDVREEIIY